MPLITKAPVVSVVLPILNGKWLLPEFFKALKAQSFPAGQIEVVVVDNGSSDGSTDYVLKNWPGARLISIDHNLGSAKAENLGVKLARGHLVFITNDDAIISPNCLTDLVRLIKSDPQVAMVSGKLLYQDPWGALAWPGFKLNPYLAYHPYDLTNLDKLRDSDWFSGPAMLIKKTVFDEIGGFDEAYFFCGEDYDLSLRLKQAGYNIKYCPTALIYHGFSRNRITKGGKIMPLYLHYRGKMRCVLKHASWLQKLTSFIFLLLATPVYWLFIRPHEAGILLKALAYSLVWNLYHLPKK